MTWTNQQQHRYNKKNYKTAPKMTTQFQKLIFRKRGCLNNATSRDILALAMDCKFGKFNPFDKQIQTYKNKDIVDLYKKITEKNKQQQRLF